MCHVSANGLVTMHNMFIVYYYDNRDDTLYVGPTYLTKYAVCIIFFMIGPMVTFSENCSFTNGTLSKNY